MKKILITGEGSYIGVSFENYINQSYSEEYMIDTLDMIDDSWEKTDFSKYDVVFHVAGIAHQKETKENATLYYKVNCDLAIKTAQKAKREGVKQFIFLSSMSVYGMDTGVISKETLPAPKSNYGISKLMAETGIAEFEEDGFAIAVIRPPMVYGRGCRGNFNSVVKFARKLPAFPKIKNERSMIYIDNLSEFVKKVIDNTLSGIFMPQNKEYMNTCDMARWIAEAEGKKLRISSVLGLGVKIIMPFASIAKKAFGSLIYLQELEKFDFDYCVTDSETSVKRSIVSEGNSSEG